MRFFILINKNNREVNKYLEEVKNELNEELKVKKEKFSKEKLADIFGKMPTKCILNKQKIDLEI